MKKRLITIFIFLFVLGFNFQSIAQVTPEEVVERAKWEEFLKTAEIIGEAQMSSREAVTSPWRLTLKKDGITRDALWKNPTGRQRGFVEGWKWEIAAYRLDKYLELNMVPPTVEKRFHGDRGSCQLWAQYEMKYDNMIEQKIEPPSYKVLPFNRAVYLLWAFDNLIANEDRHMGNILITKDWRVILIDHSRSFRTAKKFIKQLINTERHKEGPRVMKELPRAFVEKIKSLNFELIRDSVGEYLTDAEINAVLARKELILKEIDKLIKKHGEDKVLY